MWLPEQSEVAKFVCRTSNKSIPPEKGTQQSVSHDRTELLEVIKYINQTSK